MDALGSHDRETGQLEPDPWFEKLVGNIAQFLRRHPGLFLTLAYVYLSAVGMVYAATQFQRFGINVMDYAETNDFLVAAFKEPFTLMLCLAGVAIPLVMFSVAHYVNRRVAVFLLGMPGPLRQIRESRVGSYRAFIRNVYLLFEVTTLLIIIALAVCNSIEAASYYSTEQAQMTRAGVAPEIFVQLQDGGDPEWQGRVRGALFLIGTTEKFAFFYDRQENRTLVVPIANILWMHSVAADSAGIPATPTTTPPR